MPSIHNESEVPKRNKGDENWNFNPEIESLRACEVKPAPIVVDLQYSKTTNPSLNEMQELYKKGVHPFSIPLYVITTKDCFAFDLIERVTVVKLLGRDVLKSGKHAFFSIIVKNANHIYFRIFL